MKTLLATIIFLLLLSPLSASAQASPSLGDLLRPLQSLTHLFQISTGHAQELSILTDTDEDGVPDETDQCPTIPGLATNGCPDIPAVRYTQTASRELRPALCDTAPCRVIIEQASDLVPYLDCLFGVLTNAEGSLVLAKGPQRCIES